MTSEARCEKVIQPLGIQATMSQGGPGHNEKPPRVGVTAASASFNCQTLSERAFRGFHSAAIDPAQLLPLWTPKPFPNCRSTNEINVAVF